MVRVWIAFSPFLLSDTLATLIARLDGVEVAPHPFSNVDVIVFPLDEFGDPDMGLLPYRLPPAKLLAVSSRADRALVRLPGRSDWHEIRAFSLSLLLAEVQAGQQRSVMTAAPPRRAEAVERASLGEGLARYRASLARRLAPRSRPGRLHPALLATLIVGYYLGLSTLASAEAAMPGQALYGIKRWAENAQLAVASDAHDVSLHAHFAERRLQEIEALAAQGIVMPALIDDMAKSTEAVLASDLPQSKQPAMIAALADLTRRQRWVLSTVPVPSRDPATVAALAHALQVSEAGHQQAASVIDTRAAAASPAPSALSQPTSTHRPLVDPTPTVPTSTATVTTVPSTATASRTPGPTKTPTDTPAASRTPGPTKAPSDTATVPASATPEPTSTATRRPSETPVPTETSQPTATLTPEPTETPSATSTDTPTPTATPAPTETSQPSATPSATLDSGTGTGEVTPVPAVGE